MKKIYNAPSEQLAKDALESLRDSWGDKWALLTKFLHYPAEIRTMTYTTNAIEALHAILRKNTSNRRVFPNDQTLFKLLFLNIRNLTKKWTKRQGWNIVLAQLSIIFHDRIHTFINDVEA